MGDRPPSNGMVAILLVIFFIIVAYISNLEKAFAWSLSVGVFAAVIQTKWNSRDDWRFWSVIAAFAAIHVYILCVATISEAMIRLIAPFALIDGFIMWGLTNWIERRFPRSAKPEDTMSHN